MRNTIWISMVSAALISGAACKKKTNDSESAMDRGGTTAAKPTETTAAKPQEDVTPSAGNPQKDMPQNDTPPSDPSQKAPAQNAPAPSAAAPSDPTQKSPINDPQATGNPSGAAGAPGVNSAQPDVAQARDSYKATAKDRLAKLDDQIRQVEHKATESSRDLATKLRARRDQLAQRLDTIGNQAADGWDSFKKDMDDSFDKLEQDTQDALNKK